MSNDNELTVEEIIKQNEENKRRVEEERRKHNEKVKRQYRIQPKRD